MPTGRIMWFNARKGFGFIEPMGGGPAVFVHVTAVEKSGLDTLKDGQEVSYDLLTDRGKEAPANIRLL
jgi:CspA family cold shock protein